MASYLCQVASIQLFILLSCLFLGVSMLWWGSVWGSFEILADPLADNLSNLLFDVSNQGHVKP